MRKNARSPRRDVFIDTLRLLRERCARGRFPALR
jgi:hypothetical protein